MRSETVRVMFVRRWKGERYSQTWWIVLQTTMVFLSQTCWPHAWSLSHGSHTWGRLVTHKFTDEVQNKILTTSAGFWHMMVSWVTSWVRKLYWQYSSCLEQSSVTFFTRTTSTFLKQEVRIIVNHWSLTELARILPSLLDTSPTSDNRSVGAFFWNLYFCWWLNQRAVDILQSYVYWIFCKHSI